MEQYDRGELDVEEAAATTISEYGAKIAALERKVGQLTMEIDLLKNIAKGRAPARKAETLAGVLH